MSKNKAIKKTIPKMFKEKVAISLRNHCLKIPTTDEEVEKFEEIYGTTDFELPDKLEDSNSILEWGAKQYSEPLVISNIKKGEVKGLTKPDTTEKKVPKKKTKIIELYKGPKKKANRSDYFKNIILAAEIANELHNEPTFGHIKFVKVKFLCEQLCNMGLASNYGKYAAGPLDPKSMRSVDQEFKKQKWFNVIKREQYGYKYEPLENLAKYKVYYSRYYSKEADGIKRIIDLFRKEKSDFCEIVATLFAVWKENLIQNTPTNESSLFANFYAWDESKLRFEETKLIKILAWMKENEIVPVLK